jgi:hypothetical protein
VAGSGDSTTKVTAGSNITLSLLRVGLPAEEGRQGREIFMTDPDLVRRLVTLLAANLSSHAIQQELATAGYGEAKVLNGWLEARLAGYTESSGLGRDRITEFGRQLAGR